MNVNDAWGSRKVSVPWYIPFPLFCINEWQKAHAELRTAFSLMSKFSNQPICLFLNELEFPRIFERELIQFPHPFQENFRIKKWYFFNYAYIIMKGTFWNIHSWNAFFQCYKFFCLSTITTVLAPEYTRLNPECAGSNYINISKSMKKTHFRGKC